jgi:hypothetical protein
MRALGTLFFSVLFVALGAAPAAGQQSDGADTGRTLSSSALDDAVAGHESAVDRQRAELAELLSRTEVRDAAHAQGLDMGQVESAAAGLTDAQVRTVAPLVSAAVVQDNSGGLGSITIGVGALIVILLVLILVT